METGSIFSLYMISAATPITILLHNGIVTPEPTQNNHITSNINHYILTPGPPSDPPAHGESFPSPKVDHPTSSSGPDSFPCLETGECSSAKGERRRAPEPTQNNHITSNINQFILTPDPPSDPPAHGESFPSPNVNHPTSSSGPDSFPCLETGECSSAEGEETRTPEPTQNNHITSNINQYILTPGPPSDPPAHGESFPSPKVDHPTSSSRLDSFPCLETGECSTAKGKPTKRQRRYRAENQYSCDECGKCFSWKCHLIKHQMTHIDIILCSECGKSFSSPQHLSLHQRLHSRRKPFSCSECEKCFMTQTQLVIHLRSHTGEKPYSCSECEKCFFRKSDLVIHVRFHTGEKPYSCSECEKCFFTKSDLVIHVRSHTGEKPYSCSECEKCFFSKADLAIHHRSHTGEKPYSCSECEKCFLTKSGLIRHHRSHTGEKPYSCSECEKCFYSKSDLLSHHRSHIRVKPNSCS